MLQALAAEEQAQAMVEYVLVLVALIGFAWAGQQFMEAGYGEYVKGIYYVLSLPVP